MSQARYLHACGIFVYGPDQKDHYVLAIGGRDEQNFEMDTVEMLYLDTANEDHAWENGPTLPKPLAAMALVSTMDNRLVILGGIDSGLQSFSSKIYQLTCMCSIDSCIWVEMDTQLKYPRAAMVAFPVSDQLIHSCEK